MAALERLAEIPYKIGLDMYDLLELKMRQVMDTPEAKPSAGPITVSAVSFQKAPVFVSPSFLDLEGILVDMAR